MSRRAKTAVLAGIVVIALALVLSAPVVSLGPRPPGIQASAQRAQAPAVAVPVQAVGGAVLGVVLTGALVASERRSVHPKKSRRAHR
jgi:hypothetical protein